MTEPPSGANLSAGFVAGTIATVILAVVAWTWLQSEFPWLQGVLRRDAPASEEAPQVAAIAAPPKRPTIAPRPEADVLRLHISEDRDVPMKATRSRRLIVDDSVDDEALRRALLDYYAAMRAELASAPQSIKHVYLYVFPNAKRAEAGQGEWRAMLSSQAFDGLPLAVEPEGGLKIRPRPVGDAIPTALEDQIYEEFNDAVELVDSDQAEKKLKREIARKYEMTTAALDELLIKVMASRM